MNAKNITKQLGFTILEMLIVLAIIAMIMGMIGTKMFTQFDQSKVQVTETRMKTLADSVMRFRIDTNRVPTTQEGLTALIKKPNDPALTNKWRAPYTDEDSLLDAWDKPFLYTAPGSNGAVFSLLSYGGDGVPGGDGVNTDIVYPKATAGTPPAPVNLTVPPPPPPVVPSETVTAPITPTPQPVKP